MSKKQHQQPHQQQKNQQPQQQATSSSSDTSSSVTARAPSSVKPADTELLRNSEISQYYSNKSVFITGATGFVGKALVEKLLRACPNLNKIYLLVREKKGKTARERVDELTNCKVRKKRLNHKIHTSESKLI